MLKTTKFNLFFLLFILSSTLIFSQNSTKVKEGNQAENFKATDVKGLAFELNDFNDRFILLNFSATACAPCWESYPVLDSINQEYKNHLKVITVHHDENMQEQWNKIAANNNIELKSTSVWKIQNKSKILEDYGIDGWPYYFLIDKDGIVVKKWFGFEEEEMRNILNEYLNS